MARVKRGVQKNKRRKNILAQTKGYRFGRANKERAAKEAIFHAGAYAFKHRRAKKREYRNLWALRINAAARPLGFTYSRLIDALKKSSITLDRKSLAALAKDHPETFGRVLGQLGRRPERSDFSTEKYATLESHIGERHNIYSAFLPAIFHLSGVLKTRFVFSLFFITISTSRSTIAFGSES